MPRTTGPKLACPVNRRCLEAELYFYSRIYGFTPTDEVEPVPIENLQA